MASQSDLARHYSELMLDAGASLQDVKNAFRTLSRKFHPDQFAADSDQTGTVGDTKYQLAVERQKRLNESYTVLSAELQRQSLAADQCLEKPPGNGGSTHNTGTSNGKSGDRNRGTTSTNSAPNNAQNNDPRSRGTEGGAQTTSPTNSDKVAHELFSREPVAFQTRMIQELYDQGRRAEVGQGGQVDLATAISYYRQAARMGSASASFRLGYIYLNSALADPKLAAECFGQATQLGHVAAMFNLALMYERGLGVKQDTHQAVELYTRAAAAGDKQARQRLDKIYTRAGLKQNGLYGSLRNSLSPNV